MRRMIGDLLTMMLTLSMLSSGVASAVPFATWIGCAEARFGPPLADGGRILEARTRASLNGTYADRGFRFSAADSYLEQLAFSDKGTAEWDGNSGMIVMDLSSTSSPRGFFVRTGRGIGSGLPQYTIAEIDSSRDAQTTGWSVAPLSDGGSWFVGTSLVGSQVRTRLWKLAPDGTTAPGWASSGRNLWTADDFAFPVIRAAESGAAIVFGTRGRFIPTTQRWMQTSRVLPTGAPDPAWNHAALNTLPGFPEAILRASDGYLLVFRAITTPGVEHWRALRITDSGALAAGWPDSGHVLGRVSGSDTRHPFSDGGDGLYFLDRSSSPVLHHLLGDGSRPLGPAGVGVASVDSKPVIDLDGAGGLLLAWTEDVAGEQHVRVRGLDALGATVAPWPDTGLAVSAPVSGHAQRPIAVTSDGTGGAIVAWEDTWVACACGSSASLTRVAAPVLLDTPARPARGLALATLGSHPARGTLRLALESAIDAEAELTLHDLAGRVLRRTSVAGAARREVTWTLAGIAPGVYLARGTQAGESATQRVVVVQ